MAALLGWTSFAHTLLSGLTRFALATPDIASIPALVAVWRTCLGLSAGVAALTFAAAGGLAASPWQSPERLPVAHLFLRAAAAVLGAAQSLHLVAWLIGLNNALVASIAQSPLLARALTQPQPPSGIVSFLLAVVPYFALLLVLAVVYAVRLVELFVLTAAAPLVAAAAIHPRGEGAARAWAQELAAVLLLQPAQALLLVLFQVAVVDLPAVTSPAASLVSALALIYLTLRMPGWLRGFARSAGQDGAAALLSMAARRVWR